MSNTGSGYDQRRDVGGYGDYNTRNGRNNGLICCKYSNDILYGILCVSGQNWICVTNLKALIVFVGVIIVSFIIGVALFSTTKEACPNGCTQETCAVLEQPTNTTKLFTCTCSDRCSNEELTASGNTQNSFGILFVLIGIFGAIFSFCFCWNRRLYVIQQADDTNDVTVTREMGSLTSQSYPNPVAQSPYPVQYNYPATSNYTIVNVDGAPVMIPNEESIPPSESVEYPSYWK